MLVKEAYTFIEYVFKCERVAVSVTAGPFFVTMYNSYIFKGGLVFLRITAYIKASYTYI